MPIDISHYLDAITSDSTGEEVIIAIHDAALKLQTDAYKTADIETLLYNIKTKTFGKDVRMDIYELLKRLSYAAPEVSGTPYGVPVVQISMYAPEETPYGTPEIIEEE